MSAELELRWLKTDGARGAVRRFSEFCKHDIREQSEKENFDIEKYQDAVKLIINKLDKTHSVEEVFNAD
jgi:hypothetical protein